MDMDTEEFFFIEVNPRVQVEHTVTEEVTGIDIVRAQIKIAEGKTLAKATGAASQADVKLNGHALQTRITTEDPQNNFIPDYGRISAYRSATGLGIRLDGGTAYSGRGDHTLLRQFACENHRQGIQPLKTPLHVWIVHCVNSEFAAFQPTSHS